MDQDRLREDGESGAPASAWDVERDRAEQPDQAEDPGTGGDHGGEPQSWPGTSFGSIPPPG